MTKTTRTTAGAGSRAGSSDVFMDAYLRGTRAPLAHHPPVRPRVAAGAGPAGKIVLDRADAGVAGEPARAVAVETIALGGQILTPDGPVRGWVTIEGGLIGAISTTKPSGARTLVTDGIILPGLIDLHGHPEFNVFAPWEPPKSYVNRYAWRASDPYHVLIREPQNQLLTTLPSGTQLRYAEIRALVGGATAIQGASGSTQGAAESLVRNVDGVIFGQHRARSIIDLPSGPSSRGVEDLAKIVTAITNHEVDALYVHLAEGKRDNERSTSEFERLAGFGALTAATVIIHGTALTRDQLAAAAAVGAKLVWSPQSNLRLYGETTRAADALDVGLPVALGADWLPSGSTSLLAEMKVARQELANQGSPIAAEDLVTMVTSGAAQIAGLGDKLGTLAAGRAADVLVLARRDPEPYESVCASTPNDVELVLIGGGLAYGRADWVHALAQDPDDPRLEEVLAWGRAMLLDTSFEGQPDGDPVPRLEQLRADLTSHYPPVGPIWA
jgi:5-methylthioadenosine/S-adenosylhomocysteine deaminase